MGLGEGKVFALEFCLRIHLVFLLSSLTPSFNTHLSSQVLLNKKNSKQLLEMKWGGGEII